MSSILFKPQPTEIEGYAHGQQDVLLRFAAGSIPSGLTVKVYSGLGQTLMPGFAPALVAAGLTDAVFLRWTQNQKQAMSAYRSLWIELIWDGVCQLAGPLRMNLSPASGPEVGLVTARTRTSGDVFVYADQLVSLALSIQLDVTTKLGQINAVKQHVDQKSDHVDSQTDHVDDQVTHVDQQVIHIDQKADHVDQKSDHVDQQTGHVDDQVTHVDQQVIHIDQKADHVDQKSDHVDQQTDHVDDQVTHVDQQVTHIDQKADHVDQKSDHVDSQTDHVDDQVTHVDQQVIHIDQKADHVDQKSDHVDQQTDHVDDQVTHVDQQVIHIDQKADHVDLQSDHVDQTKDAVDQVYQATVLEKNQALANRYRYMGSWAPNTDYIVGDGVLYGNSFYRRKTAGNSGATFTKANWDLLAAGVNPRGSWAANTGYLLNDLVVFRRSAYLATSDFTSGSTFSRANWLRLFSGWNPTGQWLANTQYYEDDIVRNAGSSYRVTTDHVSGATFSTSNLESVADKGDPGTLTASAFATVSLPLASTDKIVIQRGDGSMGKIDPFTTGFPDIRPSVLFDFANSRIVSPRLTFSRNTPVARFNAAGNLEAVGANVPRINHDYLTKRCLGYLAEDSRQIFAFGGMASVGIGSLQSGITATVTATGTEYGMTYKEVTISGTPTAGGYTNIQFGNNPVTAGTAYTSSVFTRIISGSFQIEILGALGGIGWGGYAPNTPTTTTLKRIWATGTPTTTGTMYPCWGCYLPIGVASNLVIRFYAPQVEVGTYPTSPLLTTTTVTRALDFCRMPISSSWFNPEEGTMFVEVQHSISSNSSIACGIGGGALDGIYIRQNTGGMSGMFRDDALPAGDATGSAWTAGTIARYAMSYKNGSLVKFYMAGVTAVTTNPYTIAHSNSWTYMSIGCYMDGNGPFNGHILKFAYWPKQLTDAQAQTLIQ